MTVVETVLVFAGIPVGVLLVVAAVVLGPSAAKGGGVRYRPGRPWNQSPVWWLPDPEVVGALPAGVAAQRASQTRAIAAAAAETADRAGASAAEAREVGAAEAERRANVAVGGASGEW